MNRELSKSIMARSKLKNKFNKNPTIGTKIAYQKQRNHCVKLLRQTKRNYYNTLQTTNIIDNNKFWACVKPFFSEKQRSTHKITLIEKNIIISKEKEIAEPLNTFFTEAVKNLDITGPKTINNNIKNKECNDILNSVNNDNRILDILEKYKQHPDIQKIRENVTNRVFFFQ